MSEILQEFRRDIANLIGKAYLEIIKSSSDLIVEVLDLIEKGRLDEAINALNDLQKALEEIE